MTDKELEPLDGGVEFVASVEKNVLDRMGEWYVSPAEDQPLGDR